MSIHYSNPIYSPNLYGDVLYTRPEEDPVPADAPAEVDEPLDRDRIAIGWAGYPSFMDGMPPLTLGLLRDMRDDPMIEFAYFLAVGPIFAGTRSLQIRTKAGEDAPPRKVIPGLPGVTVQDGPEDKFKRISERIFEDQWPDILQGLECVNFGHWTQEVAWGRLYDLIAPVRFNSFRPWEIVLVPDAFNDFAGFKLGDEERDSRYAFHAICDEHLCPLLGRPRARAAFKPWWRQTKSHDNADRIERKASGIQMMIGIMSGMTFKDANGQLVTAEQAVQTVKNAAVSGKTWTRPLFAFDKKTIEAKPELANVPSMVVDKFDWGETGPALLANIARLERLDKEIVRAYHRPEREGMQGRHGTQAEAGVQGQVAVTDSELLHADLLTQFNEQTFNRFLVTNKGPDAAGSMYWKPTPLTDAQRQLKEEVYKLLVASPVEGPDATRHLDKRELAKELELPLLDPHEVPQLPPMPTAQDQGGGANDPLAKRNAGAVGANGNGRTKQMGLSADPFDDASLALAGDNCGTGAGGFQPGNTCAKGGGGTTGVAAYAWRDSAKRAFKHAVRGIMSQGLDDATVAAHTKAVKDATFKMTTGAAERFTQNCTEVRYFASAEALTAKLIAEDAELAARVKATGNKGKVGGSFYRGQIEFGGGTSENAAGVFAHEVFHAIDGTNSEISQSLEWGKAWHEEINPQSGWKVSEYARVSPSEAFAEFGRMVMTGNLSPAEIEFAWPKSTAVFKEHDLWPD